MLGLPFEAVWLEYILFGVVMILILTYRPRGLLREKPIFTKPIRMAVDVRKKSAK